jgi:hypothetical protein
MATSQGRVKGHIASQYNRRDGAQPSFPASFRDFEVNTSTVTFAFFVDRPIGFEF